VKVDSLPLNWSTRWDRDFEMTAGGCDAEVRTLSGLRARHWVMSNFIGVIVGDAVCPKAAHHGFMKIDEYHQAIPMDIEGAGPCHQNAP